ncbi:hypothetical protein PanWU01x14_096970 [Parasponia andersonii]|uniref:Uncharacterized protein n=1 Tax=Parasponia andersonii TaxID=3476 RepID=A0A2P5D4C8_PARAD|nr:hypothetical protein PanWU01x14_096970 [Parasponia andersonii]
MLCRQCWRHRLRVSWLQLARCSGGRRWGYWQDLRWLGVCMCGLMRRQTINLPSLAQINGMQRQTKLLRFHAAKTLADLIDASP